MIRCPDCKQLMNSYDELKKHKKWDLCPKKTPRQKRFTPLKTPKPNYDHAFHDWLHNVRKITEDEYIGLAVYIEYKDYLKSKEVAK